MVLFYVTGHGWGHATRVCAVIRALRARRPRLKVLVRTEAPAWLFEEAAPDVEVSRAPTDVGMLQPNGLDIDLERTLKAHLGFVAGWDRAVEREARFIAESGAALVVGDVPALAFAAAARAQVPAVAVANFSWDWILGKYAAKDRRWRPIAELYGRSYSLAGELLRLPMHGESPAFGRIRDVPLVVSRSALGRGQARAGLGLSPRDRRRAVLLSFGGFGAGELELSRGEELSGYVFVGFGPKPSGLRADWIEFPPKTPVPHVDILAGCDAVLGKPGYGTFSEAVAHRARMLYLPREGFPEVPRLIGWMKAFGVSRKIAREDFYAGRWRAALDGLFSLKGRWPRARLDGAAVVAGRLLRLAPGAGAPRPPRRAPFARAR